MLHGFITYTADYRLIMSNHCLVGFSSPEKDTTLVKQVTLAKVY